jgi:hypothetical protein
MAANRQEKIGDLTWAKIQTRVGPLSTAAMFANIRTSFSTSFGTSSDSSFTAGREAVDRAIALKQKRQNVEQCLAVKNVISNVTAAEVSEYL